MDFERILAKARYPEGAEQIQIFKERKQVFLKKSKFLIFLAVLIFAIANMGCSGEGQTENQEKGFLTEIEEYRGYTRVVGQEEYDFYAAFVKRDLPKETSQNELEEKIRSYINEVNAVFYLGNRLELCEPYSFPALQLRMEQENASRQIRLQQGETVYGLQQFTLQTYFQYTMDNLQISIQRYLEEHADAQILEMAKAYYEKNQEAFRSRTEVVYEVSMNGKVETMTADSAMMSTLGKADTGLADFLTAAEVGDIYEDIRDGMDRTVVLKDITYGEEGFENNRELILYSYVRNELYETVVELVAKNNPVEFELD